MESWTVIKEAACVGHCPAEITVGIWGPVNVGCVSALQGNLFLGSEGNWNQQMDILVCSLEVAAWAHGMSRLGGCSHTDMGH